MDTSWGIYDFLDIPMNNGTDLLKDVEEACSEAQKIGYPVMLKCTGGGGGIGLSKCCSERELRSAYDSVQRLGQSFFSNAEVFLEKFVEDARHIEVQVQLLKSYQNNLKK